jgi:hypothetical protein
MIIALRPFFWLALTIFIGAVISILSIIKDVRKDKKISKLTWFIMLFILLYTAAEFFKARSDQQNQEKNKGEVIDAINNTHDLIGIKEFPGFTITVLVSIEELKQKRRKYIFDIGNDPNRNRISLYLDFNNNLVYSIIDNDGVPHTIKVPQKIYTFEFNTFYFLHCEYGDSKDFNFMRFSINNNHFDPLKFRNKLEIPDNLQNNNGTIFTDIEKKEFSSMTISFYSVAHVAFSDIHKENIMDEIDKFMKNLQKVND